MSNRTIKIQEWRSHTILHQVDGVIVSNTTVSRPPSLQSQHKEQTGGLSGKPLEEFANKTIRTVAQFTNGEFCQ